MVYKILLDFPTFKKYTVFLTIFSKKMVNIVTYFLNVGKSIEALALNNCKISDKTLYRWRSQRKRVLEDHKSITLIRPKNRKPINYRTSKYNINISNYICDLRKTYPKMGKSKLKVFVDRYCDQYSIETVSESTIGRIIGKLKKNKLIIEFNGSKELSLNGSTGKLHTRIITRKKKLRKPKEEKANKVGDIIQLDAVTIQVQGQKSYFINAIDLASRKAFSFPCKNLNSQNAKLCIEEFKSILKVTIKAVQTDNGLENHKHFDNYLTEENITHYWNRPATPKSNGTIERFNRTIQEECVNRHLNKCNSSNMEELKDVIKEYLYYYNEIRPHHYLQNFTPQQQYNLLVPFSHM